MFQDNLREIIGGVFTTILTGALAYFFNFFHTEVPKIKEEIKILENRFESHHKYMERIDYRTQKLYEVLVSGK